MQTNRSIKLSRRHFMVSVACLPALSGSAFAHTMAHTLPWSPFAGDPPKPINPMGWFFLTPNEVVAVEAIVDRLIPGDNLSPGGKDAGCAVFIDRQLAGSFGTSNHLYTKGPFQKGLPTQGYQGQLTPTGRYREGLKALDAYVGGANGGKTFAQLTGDQQDTVLNGVSDGKIVLKGPAGFSGRQFFELVLQNTMEGFFADPLYGGNKDMAAWKMIGFPGARYDYREYVDKYNQPYPHGPVSIMSGAPGWNVKS